MPNKKVYVARWWESGRKRKRTFHRKKDRDTFTAERKRREALGDIPVPTPDITLAELVEEYWELYAIPILDKLSRRNYMSSWESHHRKRLGGYRLRQLTPIILGNHLNWLNRQGLAPATVHASITALSSILTFARSQGRLTHNPLHQIKKPGAQRLREVPPVAPVTVERVRALLAPRDACMVSVLAYAGLRPHELWALDVEDIKPDHLWVAEDTKTGRRRVDLLAPLAQDLREHLLREGIRSGPVFRNDKGGRFTRAQWDTWREKIYKPAALKAGLGPDAVPKDLRGSFASLLIWEGHTMLEVAVQLGHSVAVCEQHYARTFRAYDPAKRTSAADAILKARTNPKEATLR